jgi:hypothetical protein
MLFSWKGTSLYPVLRIKRNIFVPILSPNSHMNRQPTDIAVAGGKQYVNIEWNPHKIRPNQLNSAKIVQKEYLHTIGTPNFAYKQSDHEATEERCTWARWIGGQRGEKSEAYHIAAPHRPTGGTSGPEASRQNRRHEGKRGRRRPRDDPESCSILCASLAHSNYICHEKVWTAR